MGKQVKGWVPPADDEIVDSVDTWSPPADDEVIDDVKKKDESKSSALGGIGFVEQQQRQFDQPEQPSEKSTAKPISTPQSKLRERVSNYSATTQNAFNQDAEKKKAELQAVVDADPTRVDAVNAEFKTFLEDREKFYNTDLDKWMGIYTDEFQKEEFQLNKETNPLKSLAKNAWATLSKDLPSQFFGARALGGSAMKKLDDTIFKDVTPVNEELGAKIEKQFQNAIEFFTGEEDKSKAISSRKEGANIGIIKDVKKSIELSKAGEEEKKFLVNSLDKVKDGDFTDWMNYAGSAVGQGVGSIPASVATRGASSLVQQMGSIYMDSIQKIAKDEGISVEEVIKQGKDDVLYPLVFGVGTGLLDAIGAKGVASGFSKKEVMDSFRDRAMGIIGAAGKGGGVEMLTEATQTGLEQIGVSKATGKTWSETLKEFKWKPLVEASLQGGIAGLFLGGGGQALSTTFDAIRPSAKVENKQEAIAPIAPKDHKISESGDVNLQDKIDQDEIIEEGDTENTSDQGVATDGGGSVQEQSGEPSLQSESNTGGLEQGDQEAEVTETPKEKASRELDELVKSGDITRDGNKVTVVTEEGGREAKRIYDELEASKSIPASGGSTASNGSNDNSGVSPAQDEVADAEEQSSEQTPPQQQSEQQPPNLVEQPDVIEETAPPSSDANAGQATSTKTKTLAIAKRILSSDASPEIKRGIKEKGAEYVPKKLSITDKEATDLLELYGNERTETLVRDQANGITGDTRTALAAKLYDSYKQTADQSTDPETKRINYDKAVDIALTSADQLKEAGRQTNAAKIWKQITSNEDMTVLAMEKEVQRQSKKILQPIQEKVTKSRDEFDAEIQRIIARKVTEGVQARLEKAKLITKEKRKQISDAFDSLKVKDVGGAANDITRVLGATVWNGSIEAVKLAVLTGADVANAIQAGVDYVRENYKGDWNEDDYRTSVSPGVEKLIPSETEKITAEDVDQDKISTPKLSGKKKKDFINQVVDAHNDRKLTDDKFDQLYAKQLGAKEITSEDRQKIRELAKIVTEVEQFENVVKNDFTRENIAKYKDLLEKAGKANDELQVYAMKPSNIWDTLISIMQGNLLTPLSLVTNIYSNAALQPLRFLSTSAGSVVDYSVSQLAKTGLLNESYRDRTIDLVELQKGYFPGGWNGLLEGLRQLKAGPRNDERDLREINTQFNAVRAIGRWADESRSTEQKVNDYIEGTLGVPAEVMFRLLNLGDKPYRRAAETARAMEIASQRGLKGQELEKFIMFPDPESKELITKAGNDATFQQESASSKFVQQGLSKIINAIGKTPIIGGPLKVVAKSQIPFVKTPWNIMVETLTYAAFPITGAVGIRQIAKGDKRSGSVLIGKALVGGMIFAVAKSLFELGLMSWDEPYDQKAGKQRERRQIQLDNIPPNSLNVSAIQRMLIGDDAEIKDDDTWINYEKLGVMGLLFDNYANNYFANIREKGQMPEESEFFKDLLTTAPRVISQSLDQSFLKGTSTLLTALQSGGGYETEKWLIDTSGALTAIILPNTVSTISKSEDEFIRDTKDDKFVEQLKNTYKTKLFIGDQLPAKVNLWGDKITGQPEGRNKYAFYLFDPTKFKEVDTENFRYKLYEAWKTDKFEDDWLPSIPRREITHRKIKIPLNGEMYEKLAISIGQERARLVSSFVNSPAFDRKDKEKVVKKLKELYEEGSDRGKKKFLMNTGWNILTPTKLSEIGKK